MVRNLDMTSLRSFVAIADAGGVTRAAGFLNLTQSAVSMQIKRLEEMLDVQLLDRSGRQVGLTAEGGVVLGVPHDIVYPAIPQVLQRFAKEYPRMRVTLLSSFTRVLKAQFARGECDVILSTEADLEPGGETIAELPLVWVGAPGGVAWKSRPLRLAYEHNCIFRQGA